MEIQALDVYVISRDMTRDIYMHSDSIIIVDLLQLRDISASIRKGRFFRSTSKPRRSRNHL